MEEKGLEKGKGSKGFKGHGKGGQVKGEDAERAKGPAAPAEATKKEEGTAQPAMKAAGIAEAGTGELMSEVTSLLRSLRVEPQLRAYKVMTLGVKEDKVVLLDGGATHCRRQARSKKEWEDGEPTMAAGSISMRMNRERGTLISEENVQQGCPVVSTGLEIMQEVEEAQ